MKIIAVVFINLLCLLFYNCAGSSNVERSSELTIKYFLPTEKSTIQFLTANENDSSTIILPKLIQPVTPEFPSIAARAGVVGSIVVKAWIDTGGNVRKTVVLHTEADLFNKSAIDAIMRWKFTPLINNGVATSCWAEIPISYKSGKRIIIPN